MEADLAKMKRYMLHHRIATYAIVLFLVLITFILISISKQVENEQAMVLDSQASARALSQTSGGNCPGGKPARTVYNGASSCYFGQYRSVSVRCNEGDKARIFDASTITKSICADGGTNSVLEQAAYSYCGCTGRTVPTPTTGGGVTLPTPTEGWKFPTIPMETPITVNPTSVVISLCKRGLNTFITGDTCASDQDLFQNASYICYGGKKGTVSGGKFTCLDSSQLYGMAKTACVNETSCKPRLPTAVPLPKKTPTPIVNPTYDPGR